jgi:hypothetical protein
MTFWTVLWISFLGGPMDGKSSFVVYPDRAACEAGARQISQTLDYDHALECEESTTASRSIRPNRRPADG